MSLQADLCSLRRPPHSSRGLRRKRGSSNAGAMREVDVKFTSGSLDRGTGRQETLDPHALGMITALASASLRPLSSCHLCPHDYKSKIEFLRNKPFQEPC